MKAALGDLYELVVAFPRYPVNEAVFAIDTSRPPAGPIFAEGLWLSDSPKRGALGVLDQGVDPAESLRAETLPKKVVAPPLFEERNFHGPL